MTHRFRRSTQSITLTLALGLCLPWAHARAQVEPSAEPTPIVMADTPLKLQGIGIEIRLPVGSTSETLRLNRETKADILGKDDAWRLTVSTRTSSNTEMDAKGAIEQILENLQKQFGVADIQQPDEAMGTFARVLKPIERIEFTGGEAYRFFIFQPADRPKRPNTVRGVGVIKIGPGQMLVWDMTAPEQNDHIAMPALDAMLRSVSTGATPLAAFDRKVAIQTGQRLLGTLTPSDLEEIFTNYGQRWYRLYENQPDGSEREIGYRMLKAWPGKRSELGGLGARERDEPGYLVEIQARTLGDEISGAGRIIYDSKGTYFVSEDLGREAWNLVVVIKQNANNSTFTEVGARDGFKELIVTTDNPSGPGETLRLKLDDDGYLPLGFSLILPTLLTATEASGDVAFYTYRSDASAVTFRHDAIRRDPDNEGGWIHRSSVAPDRPQLVKYLDDIGEILREELPGNRVWVKTDVKELARIWRQKNLPMN